jgi:5,6,7,8-tetrahydromethanopterin hydro-lyase
VTGPAPSTAPAFATQVGEAFVGEGPAAAHVNTVLGAKGGPVEAAWATALATPRPGHVPFLACVRPNVAAKPATVFVTKATVEGEVHAALTWGPAQAGVAAGVADAVRDGIVPTHLVDDLLLIAAVWVDPAATADLAGAVYRHNREATRAALAAGAEGRPTLDDVLAAAAAPSNAHFDPTQVT